MSSRQFEFEVPFIRDVRLVADDTPSLDVVLDVIEKIPGFDIVVLLQPTSPLRTAPTSVTQFGCALIPARQVAFPSVKSRRALSG